ncbi:MAG: alpha/beta fold hydrolase [Caldilineaceae bacterium]|nr:alpha/beta fold hydrolase [Caldilineaceae bacterium]
MAKVGFRVYPQTSRETEPPAVLIHGAGGNFAQWPPQVRRLPQITVYALDLPGHGDAPGPGCTTIDGYADAVLAFLDENELPPAVLVGHSMGGAVVQMMAQRAPERVAGIALVATGARLPVSPALLDGLRTDYAAAVQRMGDWVYGPDIGPDLREDFSRNLLKQDPTILIGDFVACDKFDARADLPGYTMPALIIGGDQDRMTPPRFSRELGELLPHARLHMLPDTGHMVMTERPNQTAQLLANFIQEIGTELRDA